MHLDLQLQQRNEPPNDAQAQPIAFTARVTCDSDLVELLVYMRELIGGDADPGIPHVDLQRPWTRCAA